MADISIGTRVEQERLKSALLGTEPAPVQLGRFVVIRRLGAGGMGVVLEAYDPELERGVALKVLGSLVADDAGVQARLRREALALARLSHPNVVAVYEVGTHEEFVFIVMELVRGPTLRGWLAKPQRGATEIIDAFIAAGRGLAAAHDRGLVHRDFKPDNVLFSEDGTPKVADFGLARSVSTSSDAGHSGVAPRTVLLHSQETSPVGTPRYMAPEQAGGQTADARSDQYSFCAVLREALCREDAAQPQPPARVMAVVRRGMALSPSDRWPSMERMLAQLAEASRPRRRGRLLGAAATVSALGALLWLSPDGTEDCRGVDAVENLWNPERASQVRRRLAQLPKAFATNAGERAIGQLDQYAHALRDAALSTCRVVVSPAAGQRRRVCLDNALVTFDTFVEGLVRAPNADAIARVSSAIASLPDLEACLQPQANVEPSAPIGHELARVSGKMLAFELETAMALALETLQSAEGASDAPGVAAALALVAELHLALGDYDATKLALRRAFWAAHRVGDEALQARTASKLAAAIAVTGGDKDDAEHWLKLATGVASRGALAEADALEVTRNAGAVQFLHGDHALAIATLSDGIDAALTADPGGPMAPRMLFSRAAAYDQTQDYVAARADLEQAIAIVEARLGRNHPGLLEYSINLGSVLRRLKDLDGAREVLERAMQGFEALHGPNHPDLGLTRLNLSAVYVEQGDLSSALNLLEDLPEALSRAVAPEAGWVSIAYRNRCLVVAELGRSTDALPDCRRARDLSTSAYGTMSLETADSMGAEADVLGKLGRAAEALPLRRRVVEILDAREQLAIVERVELAETLGAVGAVGEAMRVLEAAAEQATATEPPDRAQWEQHVRQAQATLASQESR